MSLPAAGSQQSFSVNVSVRLREGAELNPLHYGVERLVCNGPINRHRPVYVGNQDVPIRARVDGFLETINFIEGQDVEQGQLRDCGSVCVTG